MIHGQCLFIEENFGDLPLAALVEGGAAVMAGPEGNASIGGGHDGAGVVDFILLATIAALKALETVVPHGPEVVAVLLVDVGVGCGVVVARGGANGHAHAIVAAALAELPTLATVAALGDDGRPADVSGCPTCDEYGHVFEGVEGVAVVVGEGEVIVVEENARQIVLLVRDVGGLLVGRTKIGRVGVVAFARFIPPEEDAAVLGGKVRHDLADHDAAEVAVASAVDGGHVGLSECVAVDSDVVQILGESLATTVIVAHGVYGFTGGSVGVALVYTVVVNEGLVGGTVGDEHHVVPSCGGVRGGEIEFTRVAEIAVAVGIYPYVVVAIPYHEVVVVVLASAEGSPCAGAVEILKPEGDGEGGGMLVPERNPIGLDSHASLVLVGRYLERRVPELLGAGIELGPVEKLSVVASARGVDRCGSRGLVEVPVADEVVVAGDRWSDVGVGLRVLGDGGTVVGVQPKHKTGEGALGELGGGSVTDRAVSDKHHVALQFGGEHGTVGSHVADRLVADHGYDGGGGGESLGYVRPYAAGRGGVEGHEAIVVGLARYEIGQDHGELAFLVARLLDAGPGCGGGAAVGLPVVYVDQDGGAAVVGNLSVGDGVGGGHVGGVLSLDHGVGRLDRELKNNFGCIARNR